MEWMKPFQKTFDQNFFKSFQHLFENKDNDHNIKVNIYEGINEMLCVIFIPGIKNVENINLYAQSNLLTVSGNINIEFPSFQLTQSEFHNGNFKRNITLPYPVRYDKVDAHYERGLLIIHLYRLLTPSNEKQISIRNLEE